MNDSTRDPFELSRLPPVVPSRDAWPAIAAAMQRRRRGRAGIWAAAAAVTLALGLAWHTRAPVPAAPSPATASGTLASLEALSRQLEQRVRYLRSEAGTLPADTLVYQVELEDLVAQVDEALSRQPGSPELWSQRVNLLLDLDQLYRQSLRREQARMASL
jgi:hypothetical protein